MNTVYSAVATVYNDAKDVVSLLDNLCGQTVKPFEIVVADGGSKDETVAVIETYAKKAPVPIRVLSGKRLNISQGLNEAIRASQGELIMISAVGNRYPQNFAHELLLAITDGEPALVYPIVDGENDSDFARRYNAEILESTLRAGIDGRGMNHGCLLRRSAFARVGMFYERFYYAGEDFEFSRRLQAEGLNQKCVPGLRVIWRVPQTCEAFCRQTEVYLIAWLQLYSYKELFRFYLGAFYNFPGSVFRVWWHGEKASLKDWWRVCEVKCFLRHVRYLFPDKHIRKQFIPKL